VPVRLLVKVGTAFISQWGFGCVVALGADGWCAVAFQNGVTGRLPTEAVQVLHERLLAFCRVGVQ